VLAHLFGIDDIPELKPRYNIAPTQKVLIVRTGEAASPVFSTARWGLVPSWAKDIKIGARMINARAETVAEKPAFRSAVRRRRCLIPTSGFYEWRQTAEGKQPYLIRFSDGSPFAFAGLWERWSDASGHSLDSCTIITTEPNELVAEVHNRMPVILPRSNHHEWLKSEPLQRSRLADLLVPHEAAGMEAFPVSTRVNRPANDDPQCIEPVASDSLFS
jgi:putative SOS response-associated peptidase YedK